MQHIIGISRHQMRFSSLEDTISPDNQIRFIDAFVELIDISKLDFTIKTLKTEGRPSFNSKVFLKMYLYCYFNGVKNVRDLEKESLRNIEMQWF
ncbi:transposase [Flavobacterium caseinilyticum]|uniref:Transposase n=1 Tax=Flavobacterium caseinilyticum TaxID=2541732 RepID=A0A4R5AQJ0_9FLAO|nr:transposase [Flavobacterium caseinilyticum]TDD75161.1 transposase [Flavobacterium caseinilyticum]